ncbi:hypothetical protein E2C01_002584 [Portunus trituberculatus]|uniref:Uncharacterized protein n=1 Tax=Portunus trituberculatus TaxID=210409 RepID=A0A5B7CR54_PORTR|nr:hypothetical protein [Portunus trituberculatus]
MRGGKDEKEEEEIRSLHQVTVRTEISGEVMREQDDNRGYSWDKKVDDKDVGFGGGVGFHTRKRRRRQQEALNES